MFWIIYDTFGYYTFFFVWAFSMCSQFLINIYYYYFFFNNFSDLSSDKFKITHVNFLKSLFIVKPTNPANVLDKNNRLITYNWLLKNNINNESYKMQITSDIYSNKINILKWNETYIFFTKLYKSLFLIKKFSISLNPLFENFYFQNPINHFHKYTHLSLYFYLNNKKTYFIENQKKNLFSDKRFHYNITSDQISNFKFNNFKNGNFYFNNDDLNNLHCLLAKFNEFSNLYDDFSNHLNISHFNRWLYKYSIIHRYSIRNSNKIKMIKKLSNLSSLNLELTKKNIWMSEYLNKINKINFENINYMFNVRNAPVTNVFKTSTNMLFNNQLKLNYNLNFLEISYLWFLKRNYNFNTLSANNIQSSLLKNKNNNINDNLNTQNLNICNLNYCLTIPNSSLNLFDNDSLASMSDNKVSRVLEKDIFYLISDIDFLNKTSLNACLFFTSNLSTNENYLFFPFYTHLNFFFDKIRPSMIDSNLVTYHLNEINFYSQLNTNRNDFYFSINL